MANRKKVTQVQEIEVGSGENLGALFTFRHDTRAQGFSAHRWHRGRRLWSPTRLSDAIEDDREPCGPFYQIRYSLAG